MKIYLSGWVGETEYRKTVLSTHSQAFDIKDPLTEVERKMDLDIEGYKSGKIDFTSDIIANIVEGDIKLLKGCDSLVAMMNRYSAGTIMEIRIAYDADLPVYIIDPGKTMRRDIWLRYHTNVFFDRVGECFNFLNVYSQNFVHRAR